jgi:hypothetical protein
VTAAPSPDAVDALAQIAGFAVADEDRELPTGVFTKQLAAAPPLEGLDGGELGSNDVALFATGNDAIGTWL